MNQIRNSRVINKESVTLVTLLALFLCISSGYLLSYQFRDFPDGIAHMGYVYDVIREGFPDYRSGLYSTGEKYNHLNHPALYYLLSGYIVRLFSLQHHAVLVAQLVNMVIGSLIILITFRTLKRVGCSSGAIFAGMTIFMLLPMFPLLCASVSNDPISFLGCSVFLYALISVKEEQASRRILAGLFIGGAIAALSKATAALAIICMFAVHFLIYMRAWTTFIKHSRRSDYFIPALSLIAVLSYYIVIHHIYGAFFPSPQKGPDVMFQTMNPAAERLGLVDYIKLFFNANLFSLTQPYGHVEFEDSLLRVDLLKWLLLGLSIGVVMLTSLTKAKTEAQRASLAMMIAFILFVVFYFIALRKLHLQTGYQGALQARYFFGFLSAFALCIAVAFDLIKSNILRSVSLLVITAMTLANVYPSWIRVYAYPGVMDRMYIAQNSFYINYGGLAKGRIFQQSFTALSAHLLKAGMMIGTYSRVDHSTLNVSLLTMEGDVLYQHAIDASTIADNSWVEVSFPAIELKPGGHYLLQLTSPDANENTFVTWWAAKRDTTEYPGYAGSKNGPVVYDFYSGGDAIVDGQLQKDSDFAFKLYFGEAAK